MKNIEVIEAPSNHPTSIEVKTLDQHRTEAAKVLGTKAAESLSYDDFARVIGKENIAAGDEIEQNVLAAETRGEKLELRDKPAPLDSADYNYEELAAQYGQDNKLVPLRENAAKNLGFKWVKGGGALGNVVAFKTALNERREAKLQEKLVGKTLAEQAEFLDNWSQRRAKIKKIGMYAIAGGLTVMTFRAGLGYTSLFDDAPDVTPLAGGGDKKVEQYDIMLANEEKPLAPKFGEPGYEITKSDRVLVDKLYSNSDASFYEYAKKQHRGDFGPALNAQPNDGPFGAGFQDWMARGRHEPNGLANVMSGLGLDGKSDSLADRNGLANIYDNDKFAQARAHLQLQQELMDPTKFSVETISIDFPYKTTYMVDANGDPVISMQEYTDHGGSAFKIIDKKTGEVTYWRKECGGFQQIWPLERSAPAQPVQGGSRPQGGGTHHFTSRPPRPGTPGTPTTPDLPDLPDTPGGENPPEDDEAKDYSGGVDTADGIDPSRNGFVGWTDDPAVTGNGTDSPNLVPGAIPGAEIEGPAEGADPNTAPQVDQQEAGAGDNRTAEDEAARRQAEQAAQQQQEANERAAEAERQANDAAAQDEAVRQAQQAMGPGGRPSNEN